MLWAIVRPSGEYTIHYDDPKEFHKEESKGCTILELDRRPSFSAGETIDLKTGKVVFDVYTAFPRIVEKIRESARVQIEEFYPWWKQMNDSEDPDAPGVTERRNRKNAIRNWSNAMEHQLESIDSAEALVKFLSTIP